MDQGELERNSAVEEYVRNRERQRAGLDRHFRGHDGFGWFYQDPDSISRDVLQSARFRVKKIADLSNLERVVEGKRHQLASGSFAIEPDLGGVSGGMNFTFSHPKDIEELLLQAQIERPEELIGKEIRMYWVGTQKEPLFPSSTLTPGATSRCSSSAPVLIINHST